MVLLFLLATVCFLPIANADELEQTSPTTLEASLAEATEASTSDEIEEIIVYGDQSMTQLRRKVYKAEENFFTLFSSFNEIEEYDVRCYYEVPSFTHIRRHVCRANFIIDAGSAAAQTWKTAGPSRIVVPAEWAIERKKKRLQEMMEEMVAEHPELLDALTDYTDVKQTLKSAQDRE
jgi:hypothetical protein